MSETTRQRAAGVLLRMGVSMRTRGWDDLLTVVLLAAESPEAAPAALYWRAAGSAGVSVQTVRSGCTRAIRSALTRGLPGLPPEMSADEFIARAAALVRQED